MKRIAIADIHLSEYKTDKIVEDNYPRRLYEIILTLRKLCEYARSNKIKHIDILGDLHSDKNIIYTDAQNAFKRILDDNQDITFSIIAGNHDLSSTGDTATATIEVFDKYPNVKCYVDKPQIVDNIAILPYSHNMITYLKEMKREDILLSHFGLSEAVLQSGISIVTNIKMKDLDDKFELVLLGHYHKPQELKSRSCSLYYVGCPVHFNWNDKNEDKRFIVYDTETIEVISVPINWITQFKEYTINDKTDYANLLEEIKSEKEKGNKVRVRGLVKLDKEFQTKFNKEDVVIIDDTEVNITQRGININMSRDEKLKKYLSYKELDPTEHEKYFNIMKKIVSKEKLMDDKDSEIPNEIVNINIKNKIEVLDTSDLELNI